MPLNFNPEAYGRAFEFGQNKEDQRRQQLEQVLQAIPKGIGSLAEMQDRKRTQELQKFQTMLELRKQGFIPADQAGQSNQPMGNTPMSAPTNGLPGGDLMSSMGQSQSPQNPMGSMDQAPQQPQNTFQPMMNQSKSSVIDAWNNHPERTKFAPQKMKTPFGDMVESPDAMQGRQLKNEMAYAELDKTRSEAEKNRNMGNSGSKTFIGMDAQGNPLLMDSKTGEISAGSVPGGKILPKPAQSSMVNMNFESASPQEQEIAKKLVNGEMRTTDIGYRDRGRLVGIATDYANKNGLPYQSYSGDVKFKTSENLAFGKMGMNTLSLNTALGHVGDASKAFQGVQNSNQAWLNVPINKLKRMTNDPNIVALDLNLNALNGELATTFKNSSGTDQEIGHWMSVLNDRLTPTQAQAAIQKVGELLNSRLNAIQYQQQDVMGNSPSQRKLLSPHGSEVMKNIGGKQPTQINSQAEYDALPSGSEYIDSNGKHARKQ